MIRTDEEETKAARAHKVQGTRPRHPETEPGGIQVEFRWNARRHRYAVPNTAWLRATTYLHHICRVGRSGASAETQSLRRRDQ